MMKQSGLKSNVEYSMTLMDQSKADPENHTIQLCARASGEGLLCIGAEGYGELTALDDFGFPIVIEYHEGKFRLMIWSDINEEEPTHIINLEKARLSNRRDKTREEMEKMSGEELDEAVIEAKCGEASAINNSGKEEQIDYLLGNDELKNPTGEEK